jgi:hypothetical protein
LTEKFGTNAVVLVQGGEEVVVIERTDPADGEKTVLFWNVNGVILQAQSLAKPQTLPKWIFGLIVELWVTLNLFFIFSDLDNFPVFFDVTRIFHKRRIALEDRSAMYYVLHATTSFCSQILLKTLSFVSRLMGFESVRPELTPEDVYREWFITRKKRKTE